MIYFVAVKYIGLEKWGEFNIIQDYYVQSAKILLIKMQNK